MKKELQKIACFALIKFILLIIVSLLIDDLWGGTVFLIVCSCLCFMLIKSTINKFRQCLDHEVELFYKDYNIERVIQVHEEILKSKRIIYKELVLQQYLLLLLTACQFDKFVEVYQNSRKIARKLSSWKSLDILLLEVSSLLKEKEEFRKRIYDYKLSKYYNSNQKLNKLQTLTRNKDRRIIMRRFYLLGSYEKVIELIDKVGTDDPDNALYYKSLKERCLYHLGKEYCYPNSEDPKLLYVKQWDTLVRTGEEYYNDEINRIFSILKRDRTVSFRKFVLFYVLYFPLVYVLIKILFLLL